MLTVQLAILLEPYVIFALLYLMQSLRRIMTEKLFVVEWGWGGEEKTGKGGGGGVWRKRRVQSRVFDL